MVSFPLLPARCTSSKFHCAPLYIKTAGHTALLESVSGSFCLYFKSLICPIRGTSFSS